VETPAHSGEEPDLFRGGKFTCLKALISFLISPASFSIGPGTILMTLQKGEIGERAVLNLIKISFWHLPDEVRLRYLGMFFAHLSKTPFPFEFTDENLRRVAEKKISRNALTFFARHSLDHKKNVACLEVLFEFLTGEKQWEDSLDILHESDLRCYRENASRIYLKNASLIYPSSSPDLLEKIEKTSNHLSRIERREQKAPI
jgi:hypothetical protein